MEERKHQYYFDKLRVLAMILIIYIHACAVPRVHDFRMDTDWHMVNCFCCLACSAVAIFMMMSGYLMCSSRDSGDIDKLLKKRIPRILLPLAGWTLIAAFWTSLHSGNFSLSDVGGLILGAFKGPVMVHFWYAYTLLALYVASPVLCTGLKALSHKGRKFVLVIIGAFTLREIARPFVGDDVYGCLSLGILDELSVFGGYIGAFALGYIMGTTEKRIPNILLVTVGLISWACMTVGEAWFSKKLGECVGVMICQSAGFSNILAACIFLLFKQNLNSESRLLKKIPIVPMFLAIYFMHNILLELLYAIGLTPHSFVAVLGVVALDLVICYLSVKTAASIKPLCYLATGVGFDEACRSFNWQYTFNRIRENKKAAMQP